MRRGRMFKPSSSDGGASATIDVVKPPLKFRNPSKFRKRDPKKSNRGLGMGKTGEKK